MATRFLDGFDHYTTDDILRKWSSSGGVSSNVTGIDAAYARPGSPGKGIALNSQNSEKLRIQFDAQATWTIGFAFYCTAAILTTAQLVVLRSSDGVEQCSLRTNASSQLIVSRNGTTLGTSAGAISATTWYYVEFKVTIGNSAAYEVKLNNVSIISGTSDTQNHASESTAQAISLCNGAPVGSGQNIYIDDLYINDGTGTNTGFLGPIRVLTLRPNNAGSSADWVPAAYGDNFANVQDDANDGDQTFNMSSTPGDLDLYQMDRLPSATIKAVQTNLYVRQDAGSPRTVRPVWRISSTNYTGTTVGVGGSYTDNRQCYDVSPATSSAWTTSELNGAELGLELVS